MVALAKGRFILMAPRKVRLVLRLVRGIDVPKAQAILEQLPKRACKPIAKILKSAVATATKDGAWSPEQLMISKAMADEGPSLKRFKAGPMGRAMPFQKKMCHITLELDVKKG